MKGAPPPPPPCVMLPTVDGGGLSSGARDGASKLRELVYLSHGHAAKTRSLSGFLASLSSLELDTFVSNSSGARGGEWGGVKR